MPTETPLTLQGDALRLHRQATALHTEAKERIAALTPEQWTWSPDTSTWDIALVLDHLNIIANLMLPKMEEAIESLRREKQFSDGPFQYAWTERYFIRMLSPNPPFRVPVPPLYLPKVHADSSEIGPAFLENQRRFLRCIETASGLDWKKIKIPSSAYGWMRLTLGCWLETNVAHEQYHWMQVRALQAHPDFPTAR